MFCGQPLLGVGVIVEPLLIAPASDYLCLLLKQLSTPEFGFHPKFIARSAVSISYIKTELLRHFPTLQENDGRVWSPKTKPVCLLKNSSPCVNLKNDRKYSHDPEVLILLILLVESVCLHNKVGCSVVIRYVPSYLRIREIGQLSVQVDKGFYDDFMFQH